MGLSVTIANLITFSMSDGFLDALLNFKVYTVLLWSLILLSTAFLRLRISKWIQTLLPLIVGTIAVFDTYDSVYGLGMFVVAALIGFKYGLFRYRVRLKIGLLLGYIFISVIISAQMADPQHLFVKGLDAVLYLILVGMLLYVIYSDEITDYVQESKRQAEYIRRLKEQQKRRDAELEGRLSELTREVEEFRSETEPFDLDARGVTPAEKRVIRALIEYGGSNVELSERLELSRSTVKAHLASIYDKLGVDTRWAVADLCRHNSWDEDDPAASGD